MLSGDRAESVARFLQENREELVDFLSQLLGFQTESTNPEAVQFLDEADACNEFLIAFLREHGFQVEGWNARGSTFDRHPVLAGVLHGEGEGRTMALNGHVDVVAVGDPGAWSFDPWGEVSDGRLYGRGSVDMKGGVAAALWAVHALQECGVSLRGDLWVHLVSDEEVGGFGSRECVERLPAVDGVLDPEPTNLAIVPVIGGLEYMRIEVGGIAAHAGARYKSLHAGGKGEGGVNAIEKMVKILVALQELEREWGNAKTHPLLPPGFATLLPGIIVGGNGGGSEGRLNMITNPGTTSDYCSLEYNVWYYPDESLSKVRRDIEEYILDVARTDSWLKSHPPRITWTAHGVSFPTVNTDVESELVVTLEQAVANAGISPRLEGATFVTDLSWYEAAGVPGVAFAPGDIKHAHGPNEFVRLDDLVQAATAIALYLASWCGVSSVQPKQRAVSDATEHRGSDDASN